jgi:PGF-pre-PGF domain-containing protein
MRRFLIVALAAGFLIGPAAAQIPELPHRVYGDITDNGAGVEDLNVDFRENSGNIVAKAVTDSGGFYDLDIIEKNISDSGDGDFLYMHVEGSNTSKYVNFTAGESERIDHSGNFLTSLSADFSYSTDDLQVSVDASDASGSIDTYRWDWTGDGSFDSLGLTASHTYGSEGDYDVMLQVEEDQGRTDNITRTVSVSEETDDSGGGGGGGSGEGGSSGGGGGGGFLLPGDDDEEEKDTLVQKNFSVSLDSGSKEISLGELEKGQQVEVSVTGDAAITGFSFTSQENTSEASLTLGDFQNTPDTVVEPDRGPVYRYLQADFSGLGDFSDGKIGFEVSNNWLSSKNRGQEDIVFENFDGNNWNRLQEEQLTQTLNSAVFEAETAVQGHFSISLTEEEQVVREPSLQVTSFEANERNDSRIEVSATLTNRGNAEGSNTFNLASGERSLENVTASLLPGESQEVSYTFELEPGSHTVSMGSMKEEVTIPQDSVGFIFYAVIAAAAVLLILIGLFIWVYVRESREAQKLEKRIEEIRQGGQTAESQLDRLENDLEKLQRKLQGEKDRRNGN